LQSRRMRETFLRREFDQKTQFSRSLKEQINELERIVEQRNTELQAVNQTLRKQTGELIRSNADLERFAYLASHDLKEPLRTVSSFAHLLATRYRGKLDADADDFIRYVVDGTERMEQLIRDVLAYCRVGTAERFLCRTDANLVMARAIESLKTAIEENQALITYDPLPIVMAYETELFQLFHNLLANAIKFRSEKTPSVHVWAERKALSYPIKDDPDITREWLFGFRDNGIGMEPEHAGRIFEIFYRLHGRDEYPGTGIGLAICKKVVDHHGGRLWFDTKPQQGTTFYFTFPDR
jgi:light-regulated signal transduction histidine kinase (bacteriophytochrome)